MKKTGTGSIVNLSSIGGLIAVEDSAVYSSTKAAVLQLTRNMALDLGIFNIRVNCVCPGFTKTPGLINICGGYMNLKEDDFIKKAELSTILKRIGKPEEIANAIAFLASNEASYITGTHLTIDGGYTTL